MERVWDRIPSAPSMYGYDHPVVLFATNDGYKHDKRAPEFMAGKECGEFENLGINGLLTFTNEIIYIRSVKSPSYVASK